MGLASYIVPFVILVTIVVFIHEYGHYYFAKKYGVGVTDFSIGFGKVIYNFTDKYLTNWKISLIPLGGYVKIKGLDKIFQNFFKIIFLKFYFI